MQAEPDTREDVAPDAHAGSVLADARKIVALRPNVIGDFMFSLPALHALRHSYPGARIVLLGKQWHADFLDGRSGPVDEVVVTPPYPGVGAAPDAAVDPAPALRLMHRLRGEGVDLAVQMYGGGRYSNAFINELGARLTVGATTPGAAALDRSIPYGAFSNRRLELLQVVALAGAQPRLLARELEVTAEDRRQAAEALPPAPGERIVVLHPGASDPRRRWPPAYYAEVADALAQQGATIALSGTQEEAGLAQAVSAHMHHVPVDLSGRLSLRGLCGLLERSTMMLSNDTGPLHMALALGKPAVGIFWLTNAMEACPLSQHLLRAAIAVRTRCPVCGQDNRHARCEHDVCFVDDVSPAEVTASAVELFAATCH